MFGAKAQAAIRIDEVSVVDVADWESQYARDPLRGRWSWLIQGGKSSVDSLQLFRNQQPDGLPHFPGFSLETAKFLVKTRNVVGLAY